MLCKSHVHSVMVGSVGGIVYYNSRFGAIAARARTIPVDVNSNYLERQRALWSQAVNHWKTLTQAQRTAWEDYSGATPWKGGLGDDIYLTGQEMYIMFHSGFLSAQPGGDYTDFDDAPCAPGFEPMPWVQLACCTNPDVGVVVSITNMHLTANMDFIVRISAAQSLSRAYFKGPYKTASAQVIGNIAPDTPTEVEFCDLCDAMYFFQVHGWLTAAPHTPCGIQYANLAACTLAP